MENAADQMLSGPDKAVISAEAPRSEALGSLTPALHDLVLKRGWFKASVPARYGGRELPLPDLLRLQESIAEADGSLGWTVTLCSGAGWFGGFLEEKLAREIFTHPKLCIAGSGAVTGTADTTAQGYVLNGRWGHATGAHVASHFTANCIVRKDGVPLQEAGGAMVRAFILPASAVTIHETWNSMGLRASASHAFSITGYKADTAQAFRILPEAAVVDAPLYRYPFLPLAEATLAINLCGMVLHFIRAALPFLQRPHRDGHPVYMQPGFALLQQRLNEALFSFRSKLYDLVDQSWRLVEGGDVIPKSLLDSIGTTARQLAGAAQDLADGLYRYCGLAAADRSTEINRIYRDIHTAGQHGLLVG